VNASVPDIEVNHPEVSVDMIVVGAGMAGLSAAGFAAAHGAQVLVVDKAPDIGGSSVLSGTTLWTAPSIEAFRQLCPDGDERLGHVLVDRFPEALEWVRSTGVEFTAERSVVRFGRGYRFDVLEYLKWCKKSVEQAGGWVLPRRPVQQLLTDAGRVSGATIAEDDGLTPIGSHAVLLATGGFQGSPDLRRRYLGAGRDLALRSNSYSTGDGLMLARALGARMDGDFAAFYGHSIAAPLDVFAPAQFAALTVQYSAEGIVVNLAGERFTDESLCDHITAQRLVREPQARGLVIVDQKILHSPSLGASRLVHGPNYVERSTDDVFGDAVKAGAHVASGSDLDLLAATVDQWGFAGSAVADTVRRFNADLAQGLHCQPPRRWNRKPVDLPPFWAIEIQPSVTFTEGGIGVDTDARVLRADGSAYPGLFAAGADLGGIYNGGYAGGLALALVFGLQAARRVLADKALHYAGGAQ
jgi:succinate dehydrogenase/fumarate reductase flavoprotein subunit